MVSSMERIAGGEMVNRSCPSPRLGPRAASMLTIGASSRGVGRAARLGRLRWNVSSQFTSGVRRSTWRRFHRCRRSSTASDQRVQQRVRVEGGDQRARQQRHHPGDDGEEGNHPDQEDGRARHGAGFVSGVGEMARSTRSGGPAERAGSLAPSERTMMRGEAMPSSISTLRATRARDSDSRRAVEGSSGVPGAKADRVMVARAGRVRAMSPSALAVAGLRVALPGPKVMRQPPLDARGGARRLGGHLHLDRRGQRAGRHDDRRRDHRRWRWCQRNQRRRLRLRDDSRAARCRAAPAAAFRPIALSVGVPLAGALLGVGLVVGCPWAGARLGIRRAARIDDRRASTGGGCGASGMAKGSAVAAGAAGALGCTRQVSRDLRHGIAAG